MEAIQIYRDAMANLSGMRLGLDRRQPRLTVSQQRLSQQESDVLALPQDLTYWQPLQTAQGQFYLMADYDAEGAHNTVVR